MARILLLLCSAPVFATPGYADEVCQVTDGEGATGQPGCARASSYHWPRASWLDAEVESHFEGRPPREAWEERLLEAVEAARPDPCNAAVLVNAGTFGTGFGSRMMNVAGDVWLAAYDSRNSIALCAESPFVSSTWMALFENTRDFPVCRSSCKERYPGLAGSWNHAGKAAERLLSIDRSYMADLKRFVFASVFVPKANISQTVARSLESIGLKAGEYVGVHIRHRDKGREALRIPVEFYAARIMRILSAEARGIRIVFLASDDKMTRRYLQDELGDAAKVVWQKSEKGNSYSWRTDQLDTPQARASERVLLTDIMALRQAKVFVGTASSTFGRLVYHLRGPSEPSVSLDLDSRFDDFGA